jgi:DNA (cytosine-5)-methyltransferase 1
VAILREAEGKFTTEEVCRKHSALGKPFYRWKTLYGDLDAAQAQEPSDRRSQALAEKLTRPDPSTATISGLKPWLHQNSRGTPQLKPVRPKERRLEAESPASMTGDSPWMLEYYLVTRSPAMPHPSATTSRHSLVPGRKVADRKDQKLLLRVERMYWQSSKRPRELRAVDLFCGCGGMTLGLGLAAREAGWSFLPTLSVDLDETALRVHKQNFRRGTALMKPLEELFNGALGAKDLTESELELRKRFHKPHFLVGGPPCQGNSNLNNHTRRADPRNRLYARMARAAQVLEPTFVIIENVPNVVHDRGGVVEMTKSDLERQGYQTADAVLTMTNAGVPQARKRHILLGVSSNAIPDPHVVLSTFQNDPLFGEPRSLGWALGDLKGRGRGSHLIDRASIPNAENQKRMDYLIENDEYRLPDNLRPQCHRDGNHTYYSVYGRLNWNMPAPTITTGFGSMGQGCFVHPKQARTITPREAARIQTFPDFFDFSPAETRKSLQRLIGNAVPPFFIRRLARPLLDSL